jgi:uncharacterized protein YecT (DUF1311 family)
MSGLRLSRAALLLLAAGACPDLATAQDCGGAASQAELSMCADADYRAADAALNVAYREVEARLADLPDTRHLLVAAQRAWIAFRDASCAFAASGVEGGSIYPMILSQCLAGTTRDRTADLAAYLDCAEGDLSCPVP